MEVEFFLNIKACVCFMVSLFGYFQDVEFTPLAAGGVPGMLQTVLRAELTAAIAACRAAIKFQRPFYIWTDCQWVFDRNNQYASMKRDAPTSKQKDHDLWGQLQAVLHVCCKTNLFQKVLKITSHVGDTQFSHLVDSWAARGNEAADTMASKAIALLPARVCQAHRRLAIFWKAAMLHAKRCISCLLQSEKRL